MKISARRSWIALTLLGGIAAGAMAQTPSVDRDRIRAEAAAAVAAGLTPRGELSAADLAAPVVGAGRPRAQLRAETLAAVALGLTPRGESGGPVEPFESTRARAEVKAETLVAMQLQLIPRGEAPVRDATPRELELIRLAGERARAQQLAAR